MVSTDTWTGVAADDYASADHMFMKKNTYIISTAAECKNTASCFLSLNLMYLNYKVACTDIFQKGLELIVTFVVMVAICNHPSKATHAPTVRVCMVRTKHVYSSVQ